MKVLKCLVSVAKNFDIFIVYTVITRGGVKDKRLEAKATDTKKIRGQGEPLRGQTLSRPRTGMLEAKDQGHKRKCYPKKKIFTKIFQAISKKKTKIFQAISKKKKRSSQKFFRRPPQKTFSKKIFRRSLKF